MQPHNRATMDDNTEKERIGAAVPLEVKRKMRIEAARRDKPMSDLMRSAIKGWLEKHADESVDD